MATPLLTPKKPAEALELVQDRAAARCLLHPVRLRIVEHLVSPDSAAGVARRLRLPRQRVNYHLRELERHGLVRLVEEERHGAGTERLLQARARAYALGPKLLGRLAPDRAFDEEDGPEARLVLALTRALRELAGPPAGGLETSLTEMEVVVADAAAFAEFTQDLQRAVDLLSERYRAAEGVRCRVLLGTHPAASFEASLPPPLP